ncbi:hypothetical protein TRVA0_048S01156 [Trichomonascus vanleenenianus]|uniref:uncharacterized protein n=1 Tax=Trichomonascus vanleenenianus TaxID=2268995 RepID=UPI003ECA3560
MRVWRDFLLFLIGINYTFSSSFPFQIFSSLRFLSFQIYLFCFGLQLKPIFVPSSNFLVSPLGLFFFLVNTTQTHS